MKGESPSGDCVLSQEGLAEAAGVSARSINRWEQGRALPQPDVRRRLADVLDIDIAELTEAVRSGAAETTVGEHSIWHVPLRRNPFFTGRESLLDELHTAVCPEGSTPRIYALTGLAGVGKTQAALEYTYRYASGYEAVFWVSADTAAGVLAGLGELATLLALPVRSAPHFEHAVAAVSQWLRQHQNWLIILDNLEDPAVIDQIALVGRGAVLITTRVHAIGAVGGAVEVPPLPEEDGASFLLRRSKIGADGQASAADAVSARTRANRLGGLPLALDQTAGYLEETGCGLDVYLDRFQSHRQNPAMHGQIGPSQISR